MRVVKNFMLGVFPLSPPDNLYDTFMNDLANNVCGPIAHVDRYGVNIYDKLSYVNINRKHPLFQKELLPQDMGKSNDMTKINALRVLFKNTVDTMANGCEDLEWKQIVLHKAAVALPKRDYLDATVVFPRSKL